MVVSTEYKVMIRHKGEYDPSLYKTYTTKKCAEHRVDIIYEKCPCVEHAYVVKSTLHDNGRIVETEI